MFLSSGREDLLAIYSADATAEVDIEIISENDGDETIDHDNDLVKRRTSELRQCEFSGCHMHHTRHSGYCDIHEVKAKEVQHSFAA